MEQRQEVVRRGDRWEEERGMWASGFYGLSRSMTMVIPSMPGFTG